MQLPRGRIDRLARQAASKMPVPLVERLPSPLGDRFRVVRERQAQVDLLPPEGLDALDNQAYNRRVWDWYAERWSDLRFRQRQLDYEGRGDEDAASIRRLGEEWGRLEDARQAIAEWILPHVGPASVVGEIGTGGGRIACMVAPGVGEFHAFDVSERMLDLLRRELPPSAGLHLHHLPEPVLPADLTGRFDLVYAFDVFVHLDLHVQWRYVREMARVLKPGGRAVVHTADLTSAAGWERFAGQDRYRVEGFYFVTPQAVRTLAARAGLQVEREQSGAPGGNFYYGRDYLATLVKPAT